MIGLPVDYPQKNPTVWTKEATMSDISLLYNALSEHGIPNPNTIAVSENLNVSLNINVINSMI